MQHSTGFVRSFLLVLATVAVAAGCSPWVGYTVTAYNRSEEKLWVETSWGENQIPFGVLVAGADKGDICVMLPIPDKAVLEWEDSNGAKREKAFPLPVLPKRFDGEFVFEFTDLNTVELRVLSTRAEVDRYWAEVARRARRAAAQADPASADAQDGSSR